MNSTFDVVFIWLLPLCFGLVLLFWNAIRTLCLYGLVGWSGLRLFVLVVAFYFVLGVLLAGLVHWVFELGPGLPSWRGGPGIGSGGGCFCCAYLFRFFTVNNFFKIFIGFYCIAVLSYMLRIALILVSFH